jgi:hypothetical protein
VARNRPVAPRAFSYIPPPDPRRPGPLTSDDRAWYDSHDPTRGGDIQCSGVLGDAGERVLGVRTVNASELSSNLYGVGSSGEDNDEHQKAQ